MVLQDSYPIHINVIKDFYGVPEKNFILKYKKLLHSSGSYIILGIKPGRKLPPKRD